MRAPGPDATRSPAAARQSRRRRSARRCVACRATMNPRPPPLPSIALSSAAAAEDDGPPRHPSMPSAVQDLLAILDLEQLEVNLFRGRSPQVGWQRVFGGQVIGQALVAACRTVDVAGRPPHSLHAYLLLPGDPKVPTIYELDPI